MDTKMTPFPDRHRQEPLMFRLKALLFGDQTQTEPDIIAPIRNRTVALLMALAGAGALLFGVFSGVLRR